MEVKHLLHSHQRERPEVVTPQPVVEADIETPAPPAGDLAILRLNQEKKAHRVYESLRDHQQATSEKLRLLHTYLPLIVERFFGTLPLPAISCERDRITRLGSYRPEDGLALCHRININDHYMDRPLSELLATLTHELGHLHQRLNGKPGRPPYHNKDFQAKMLEVGIPCTSRGHSLGMQEPFVGFLKELGVEADTSPFKQEGQTPTDGPTGASSRKGSHLRPWACSCTRVWASVGTKVDSTCNKCGIKFSEAVVHRR